MEIIGLAISFLVTLLVAAVILAVTNTRRWHDRHHQTEARLMCDRCIARYMSR